MPAPAENAFETPSVRLESGAQLLVNQEVNSQCRFTKACGSTCILAQTNAAAADTLSAAQIESIGRDLVAGEASYLVRHYCAAGKEPFETPERILAIARAWHSAPQSARCGSIGAISASAQGIWDLAPTLADEAPLSWLLASIDDGGTGLRREANNNSLLSALFAARKMGAFEKFGINTLLTAKNREGVIAIGEVLARRGADQWSVGALMVPSLGSLVPVVGLASIRELIDTILSNDHLSDGPMQITVDLDFDSLVQLTGPRSRLSGDSTTWRYEYRIDSHVTLIALNPSPDRFLRVRWDGEMLSMNDFMTVGLRRGSLGNAASAGVTEILKELATRRVRSSQESVAR